MRLDWHTMWALEWKQSYCNYECGHVVISCSHTLHIWKLPLPGMLVVMTLVVKLGMLYCRLQTISALANRSASFGYIKYAFVISGDRSTCTILKWERRLWKKVDNHLQSESRYKTFRIIHCNLPVVISMLTYSMLLCRYKSICIRAISAH